MLLTSEELDARIALYTALKEAVAEYERVSSSIPEACPEDLTVHSDEFLGDAPRRAAHVVRRAWSGLRAAILVDAQKKVDNAEAAVKAFELGQEIKDVEKADGSGG